MLGGGLHSPIAFASYVLLSLAHIAKKSSFLLLLFLVLVIGHLTDNAIQYNIRLLHTGVGV